jgi:TPR repeat protein
MANEQDRNGTLPNQTDDFAANDMASMLEWITGNGQEHRAYQAIEQGDYEQARRLLEPVAARGSIYSLLTLGGFYESGKLGPADMDVAISYYELAAAQGSPEAHRRLGRLLYDLGEREKARAAFEYGAEAGNISCMYWLGLMTLRGEGGPTGSALGTAWLQKAAAEGHWFAKRKLLSLRGREASSIFQKLLINLQIAWLAMKAGKDFWKDPDNDRHR